MSIKGGAESGVGQHAALLAAQNLFGGAARAASRNRKQKIAFVVLTLGIAVGGAFLARFVITPTQLVFAVGPDGSGSNRFAQRLQSLLANNRRIRIVVSAQETPAAAAQVFAQHKADLLIARTDTKIPARSRAIALLEHSVLLIAAPKANKPKSISALKGKRLAVASKDPRDMALVRQILAFYDIPANAPIEARQPEEWAQLFEPGGPAAVFFVARKSGIAANKFWLGKNQKAGFELIELDGVKGLVDRIHGAQSETLEAGFLLPSPQIPDDDVESLAVDDVLIAPARLSNANAAELATAVLENKEQLAEPGRYATNIEPPDTEKDAAILAHPGAAEYVGGDTKTFVDRYSDIIYLGMSLASVVGSIFLGLYSTVTRVSPLRADQLTGAILELGEKATEASDMAALAVIEKELNQILSQVLVGLREGSIAHEGFDAFRLAFDIAREAIATQRNILGAGNVAPNVAVHT